MVTMDSDYVSDSDNELQEAFAEGKLKSGLNVIEDAPKIFVNNVNGMKQKLSEIKLNLPWIETLQCVSKEAPLAPQLAAQLLEHEQKRENQQRNNKKLPQFDASEDPVLNDFKRETMFHRQAQATVMYALPKLKALHILIKRPDAYFAEMAKTDDTNMQKIREHLLKKQAQEQRSEKVKQLRQQRKEGKMLQVQTKLQQQKEKKEILDKVKKVRKGISKDLDFLDNKKQGGMFRKSIEKRKLKDKKFGYGCNKKELKQNTRDSAADISEYRRSSKPSKGQKTKHKRPGKSKRLKSKAHGRKYM